MMLYYLFAKTETNPGCPSYAYMAYKVRMHCGVTWDVVSIIFDVHLVQASLCRGVFHSDGAVLVVCNMRTGSSARGHPHFT